MIKLFKKRKDLNDLVKLAELTEKDYKSDYKLKQKHFNAKSRLMKKVYDSNDGTYKRKEGNNEKIK